MKLKRLFTAILSAALTLSLCAMPAMATEGGTTAGTPLADGMPVWDTTKKGSIWPSVFIGTALIAFGMVSSNSIAMII